jgi:L-fucose isomerase-like protein
MKVGLIFGVSELADPKSFSRDIEEFKKTLEEDFDVVGGAVLQSKADFKALKEQINFNNVDALVIFPLTGGTEGFLKEFSVFRRPTVFYGTPFNNSLASAIELREHFRDRLIPSALVKSPAELKAALLAYEDLIGELDKFLKARIGLIGRVSPWLINERLDIPYTHISLKKFFEYYERTTADEGWNAVKDVVENAEEIKEPNKNALIKAGRIYVAIRSILKDYRLEGFTIGCFDLIGRIGSTPCLALAMFNAEGIPAACEGELNSLLGMMIVRKFFDKPAFMGNLADFDNDHILLAHCTAPLISRYRLRTHFESGTGVGVAVELPPGKASLFKIRGRHAVVAGVEVEENEFSEFRCRTQVRLKIADAPDFIDGTLGNHHLLAYVDPEELSDLLSELGFEVMLY